jgi:uncharacterized protein (DUF1501 family)
MNAHWQLHRRDALRLAGFGGAAWLSGAAGLLARAEQQAGRHEPARSIIMLWLAGGPSQLETFDPHPGTRIAAGTRAIETSVPGVELAEGFERLAEQMESVTLIRSLTSKEGDHERGAYHAKTGYRPDPTIVHPSIGAAVCHELPLAGVEIPRHVSILPDGQPARGGFLGAEFDAFQVYDLAGPLPDVSPAVSAQQMQSRLDDLAVVERAFALGRTAGVAVAGHRNAFSAARRMMTSDQLAAFDVSRESRFDRDRYGDTPFGRGCLAARRLIEVGVRCVEVTLAGWDSHVNNHAIHRDLIRVLDPAFAALVADLKERDLLSRTVVLCGGEFGRTPRMNGLDGRDHWPHNFAWAVAGGSLPGGLTLGESDPTGGNRPAPNAVTISDLYATVLHTLGLDAATELMSPIGRPIKLSEGTPIHRLCSKHG